ncbi:MAG: EAL domain-containing protein [Lachnospiraceae bacterium]|nr:EAL domain-containing protein [Lachnospiraceae bacterium]
MSELNAGLIYTNDKCIGCNRCISACPVLSANVSQIVNGESKMAVDPDKCIHCGNCLKMCRHGAREYRDDTELFLADVKSGKKFSLLVEPMLLLKENDELRHMIGYVQKLCGAKIYSTGVGADIMTWSYINYMQHSRKENMISALCPAVVNYVSRYQIELLDQLVPVQGPMMSTAIYARKYLQDVQPFAYIGSCIAKKDEMNGNYGGIKIDYNITVDKLQDALKEIDFTGCEPEIEDLPEGLGVMIPSAGSLTDNIVHFEGYDKMMRKIDGDSQTVPYLDRYNDRMKTGQKLPFLVDAVNCKGGCLGGPGMNGQSCMEDCLFGLQAKQQEILGVYDDGKNPYCKVISRQERKRRIYEFFSELDPQDFQRDFVPELTSLELLPDYDEDAIFNSMYKYTEADRHIDCHSCGYDSCREMVKAIAYGYNFKKNCVHYVKDENVRLFLTDTLSGIPNTNAFMKRVTEAIQDRSSAAYFAIYFNVHNMTFYNRRFGSKTGDIILADYARLVNKIADEDEIVARWGGDNFVGFFKKEHMDDVLKKLDNVVVPVSYEGNTEKCHIGFRAAVYELNGQEKAAGHVMGQITTTYSVVKQSKKHIIFFDEELGKKILHNTMVEEMLEPALKNEEFVVYYQPKVSMDNQKLVGAEALVRWVHDDKLIPPGDFIPICENNGFVQKIDFYVLERVCQDIRRWLNEGLELVKISFNFSKQHFAAKDVAKRIREIAEMYKVPKELLEVEFTETAYFDEFNNLVDTIAELKEYNIQSSIDDFGTGYSSLSLLQNVPFNTLKLDKSFLNEYAGNKRNKAVIANIIHMAKELDMDIVAEGIETKEEFSYLKMLSCDVAQGYYFDRPLPRDMFEMRLKNKQYAEGEMFTTYMQ